ncbi:hypothetical protein [Pontibacter sp. G13]|uniref:hypothetical protein n=1 Tax=Pontibacter sp. G13 TaxID=3074898 RepID=UPI00288C59B0|nr:hypothetical protein [Pontibacter sp. G13]WNJ17199.1 hypothetical protein RJD25_20275 [Pontibacter sp. G13]
MSCIAQQLCLAQSPYATAYHQSFVKHRNQKSDSLNRALLKSEDFSRMNVYFAKGLDLMFESNTISVFRDTSYLRLVVETDKRGREAYRWEYGSQWMDYFEDIYDSVAYQDFGIMDTRYYIEYLGTSTWGGAHSLISEDGWDGIINSLENQDTYHQGVIISDWKDVSTYYSALTVWELYYDWDDATDVPNFNVWSLFYHFRTPEDTLFCLEVLLCEKEILAVILDAKEKGEGVGAP